MLYDYVCIEIYTHYNLILSFMKSRVITCEKQIFLEKPRENGSLRKLGCRWCDNITIDVEGIKWKRFDSSASG